MASGDTKTQQYLDIAANGTRADLPGDGCCNTRTQGLILGVAERIMDVEDEVEELKNNPDVADIVPTYAALQTYDTSTLTDKDVLRVLVDETHDGQSTYYRYSAATQQFTYIGVAGDYYTKAQTDTLLAGKQDNLIAGTNITIASDGKTISADGLVTLSYGNSTWNDFITAYNAGKLVYCRASSAADPSSGAQTRMAFMAYVNNPTSPTEVEFQYVRSVSNKTVSQQMDQVFVYKLTSTGGGTWTVATRDMAATVAAGTNAERTYSNGTVTINPRLYTVTGQNTDGGVTQKLFTDTVGDVAAALNAINNGTQS